MPHCIIFNYGRVWQQDRSLAACQAVKMNGRTRHSEREVGKKTRERCGRREPFAGGSRALQRAEGVPNSQTDFCHLVIKFARVE
jgi:hypothetical protein